MTGTLYVRDRMKQAASAALHQAGTHHPNAGLLMSRAAPGDHDAEVIGQLVGLPVPETYERAFRRWEAMTSDERGFRSRIGRLAGRLFIGSGQTSVLGAAVSLMSPYGIPLIPGSSVKGVVQTYARECQTLDGAQRDILFGSGSEEQGRRTSRGCLAFHDAWWVPDSCPGPFAREVVTPHHSAYYQSRGEIEATDFDSPIPAALIAVRGAFRFVVEGDPAWAGFAMALLTQALMLFGIGGKRPAYGRLVFPGGRGVEG